MDPQMDPKMDPARQILEDPSPKKAIQGPFKVYIGKFFYRYAHNGKLKFTASFRVNLLFSSRDIAF